MAFDPVIQWARRVAAFNERDWTTYEALHADDLDYVTVVGDLYSATPTVRLDKSGAMAISRSLAKQGSQHHTKSLTGAGDTIVTTFEDTFDDGSSQVGYGIIRFNGQGQAQQIYATVPVLAGAAATRKP
jgi:hypothetical protein